MYWSGHEQVENALSPYRWVPVALERHYPQVLEHSDAHEIHSFGPSLTNFFSNINIYTAHRMSRLKIPYSCFLQVLRLPSGCRICLLLIEIHSFGPSLTKFGVKHH